MTRAHTRVRAKAGAGLENGSHSRLEETSSKGLPIAPTHFRILFRFYSDADSGFNSRLDFGARFADTFVGGFGAVVGPVFGRAFGPALRTGFGAGFRRRSRAAFGLSFERDPTSDSGRDSRTLGRTFGGDSAPHSAPFTAFRPQDASDNVVVAKTRFFVYRTMRRAAMVRYQRRSTPTVNSIWAHPRGSGKTAVMRQNGPEELKVH